VAIDCGALSKELAAPNFSATKKARLPGPQSKNRKLRDSQRRHYFPGRSSQPGLRHSGVLLRVVQERKMRRVGGTKDIELDVRIIVASNEKLWDSAKKASSVKTSFTVQRIQHRCPPLRNRPTILCCLPITFFSYQCRTGKTPETLQSRSGSHL
jgi:two-component system response regulator HydG